MCRQGRQRRDALAAKRAIDGGDERQARPRPLPESSAAERHAGQTCSRGAVPGQGAASKQAPSAREPYIGAYERDDVPGSYQTRALSPIAPMRSGIERPPRDLGGHEREVDKKQGNQRDPEHALPEGHWRRDQRGQHLADCWQ